MTMREKLQCQVDRHLVQGVKDLLKAKKSLEELRGFFDSDQELHPEILRYAERGYSELEELHRQTQGRNFSIKAPEDTNNL